MSVSPEGLALRIPAQDLDVLTFAQPNARRVKEWVESLPQMNVGETSKLVYAAVQEICRLRAEADSRMQMLESLRGPVGFICVNLGKHFLDKSVILPPREAKIANLAQALQNHMATGYKVVAMQSLRAAESGDKDARRLFVRALHRALCEMTQVLLRSFQLYFPAPPGYWREMHQILMLAEVMDSHQLLVDDPEEGGLSTTIFDLYRRIMLLATAKPNQLRQNQILQVYRATAQWFEFCQITPGSTNQGLFLLNLVSDSHPVYPALQRLPEDPAHARCFDASRVSDLLRVQLQLPAGQPHPEKNFVVPPHMQPDLIRILIQAWGVLAERAFTRIDERGQIKLLVGLSSTHYYISNKQDFTKMVRGQDTIVTQNENRFLYSGPTNRRDVIESFDVWNTQTDRNVSTGGKELSIEKQVREYSAQQQGGIADSDKYPTYSCDIVNTSPGGFCVSWKQDMPPQVKTGEVVGVQERDEQPWSIGVIRWVKQFRNEGARMGIELLAPKADACGTQVIQKKGTMSEYMRTLMLPELKAVGQPATLVTPNVAFAVGCKVNIAIDGSIRKAQLVKQVNATASFAQFQFKLLNAAGGEAAPSPQKTAASAAEDDFDSIWSSL